jgi:Chalcone isomerase-like
MTPRATFRRQLVFTVLLAPLLPRAALAQVRFEGQTFDARARVAGADLVLNGVGVRAVAWFKGFLAALYLSGRTDTAAQAVAMPGAKRLQLRMLHDVPATEFAKAFHKGMGRNTEAAELPQLAERMERFETLVRSLGTLRKGDTVNLDLEPARGTVFGLNGTLRGEAVPGEDFYAALLRSFLGDKPYDKRLKAGLLGREA